MPSEQRQPEEIGLDDEVEMIALQLRDLKAEMLGLQSRARNGDISSAKEAQSVLREVRGFLRSAAETEARLAEYRGRESGSGGSQFVLDLDGARASIRCRLDRLRRCQRPG